MTHTRITVFSCLELFFFDNILNLKKSLESTTVPAVLHYQLRRSRNPMTNDMQLKRLFEQCVDEHADSLYRVAFRLMGSRELAEELVQETYLNAWRNISSLRDSKKLKSWMFAVLRNQYGKLVRRVTKNRRQSVQNIDELAAPSDDSNALAQFALRSALQELNDDHKLPLLLVAMEGMTAQQAAEILEIPRGTVLSRLHRGREKLKEILNRSDPEWINSTYNRSACDDR